MVSTLDFESSDPSSNLGRTYLFYSLIIVTPWRNGSASDSRSEGCVFESRRGHQVFVFKILFINTKWLRGATVARLTPDQKAACSNHVGVRNILSDGGMQRREDSQWSESTRNGKISVTNKLKQYIFSTAVLSPKQTQILWKVLRFQENNVASNEDWTHDLWFTRPTLCHWTMDHRTAADCSTTELYPQDWCWRCEVLRYTWQVNVAEAPVHSGAIESAQRRWYNGQHSCLPSSWSGFDSRPTQYFFYFWPPPTRRKTPFWHSQKYIQFLVSKKGFRHRELNPGHLGESQVS